MNADLSGTGNSATHFPTLFRTYLANGVKQALCQIERDPQWVQQELVREQILQLLTFALDAPDIEELLWTIVKRITPTLEQAGLWEHWVEYLVKLAKRCDLRDEQSGAAFCAFWLGQFYQNQHHFDAAHAQWTRALQLFSALGEQVEQAKCLNRLAYLARLQRAYTASEQYVDAALQLLAPGDPERAHSHFVQGVNAFDQQQWLVAVDRFQLSLCISEQHGDEVTIARHLRNLGPALRALGRYAEAIACYERAMQLFDRVYDPVQKAVTQMNLGVVYLLTEQPTAALAQFEDCEAIFQPVTDRLHLAMLYTNRGIGHRMCQEWANAEAALTAAIRLWHFLGHVASQVNALDELALTHIEQGRADAAIQILQQALGLLEQLVDDPAYCTQQKNLMLHLEQAQALQ